ncbi:MAG: RNA polymerase sigma factor [Rickettsiales bacterium]
MDNEETLIEQAKKGDALSFNVLLERNYDMVYRVAYRFLGDSHDAEDIAQEVCVGLVHKLSKFDGRSSFSTWLYRVVVNSCRDFCKKNSNHRSLEKKYIEFDGNEKLDKDDTNSKVAWLYRQINTLDEPLRETALLVIAEELNHAEVGRILGCAESTISWRMSEVRKYLKKAVDGYYE